MLTRDLGDNPEISVENAGCRTDSSSSWKCVADWLKTCTKSHPACKNPNATARLRDRTPTWYPTRLLDLGTQSGDGGNAVKLIETSETMPNGPYLTLSHCWGNGNPNLTTSKNIQDLKAEINCLPKTFEDAVLVARRLQVRYLWIDSLCILQGGGGGWATGSGLMSKVYQNALCNIAAAASINSTTGLFFERTPLFPPIKIPTERSETSMGCHSSSTGQGMVQLVFQAGARYPRYPQELFEVIDYEAFSREIETAPLQKVSPKISTVTERQIPKSLVD